MSKVKKLEKLPLTLKLGAFLKRFKILSKIFPNSLEFKTYLLEQSYSDDLPKLKFSFFKDNLLEFLKKPENREVKRKVEKRIMNHGKRSRLRSFALNKRKGVFVATTPSGSKLPLDTTILLQDTLGTEISNSPERIAKELGTTPYTVFRDNSYKISNCIGSAKRLCFFEGEDGKKYDLHKIKSDQMLELYNSPINASYIERFSFTVTQDEVNKRLNQPRIMSQNQVMDGISAIKALRELGLPINESENGHSCHWAHRQAHGFGGAQAKENLDSMTAAANYQTLMKVETPIFELLALKKAKEVLVSGIVLFHEELYITKK
jgi:hypothetical protein